MMPAKPVTYRSVQLSLTTPFDFAVKLDRIARETGRTRASIVREAIERVVFADYDKACAGKAGLGNEELDALYERAGLQRLVT